MSNQMIDYTNGFVDGYTEAAEDIFAALRKQAESEYNGGSISDIEQAIELIKLFYIRKIR